MRVSHGLDFLQSTPCAIAIGNFDGIHLGHQAICQRLKALANSRGLASKVVSFEPHPREFFTPDQAPARLTSMREKLEIFAQLKMDGVHIFHFDQIFSAITAERFVSEFLVEKLNAKIVLVGKNFRFGAGRQGTVQHLQQWGEQYGFDAFSMDEIAIQGMRVSSTAIREALATGRLKQAATLLGRPYSISGHVVHGDKVGRELGYPTANVQMHHDKPPLTGIYAVKLAGVDAVPLPGVASLGVRPTVKADGKPTLEVHLFDFDRDIYGQHVQVQFLEKIRDEKKFPDLDALKREIAADERAARAFFVTDFKTQS